jgi:hypothetical protein
VRSIATLLLCLICVHSARAHRLDEYLQATRLAVEFDRVNVEIDLTPGVSVADLVLWLIDSNGDGRITDQEARAYAGRVLSKMGLELDGSARPLRLVNVTMPPRSAIKAGEGIIRLQATAGLPTLERGRHQIRFRNAHEPGMSVYLVNALIPANPGIRITKQTRDESQREYLMDLEVSGRFPGHPSLVLVGSLAAPLLAVAAMWHKRHRRVRQVLECASPLAL